MSRLDPITPPQKEPRPLAPEEVEKIFKAIPLSCFSISSSRLRRAILLLDWRLVPATWERITSMLGQL